MATDTRKRILKLYDQGLATSDVSHRTSFCPSWCRRVKQERHLPPRKVGGSKPKLDESARQQLARFVEEKPDATLEELRGRINDELQITISIGALWNTLKRMKLSFKKSR
jgi:transposase